jgi:hypothetical protein
MARYEAKTKPTPASVDDFIDSLDNPRRQADARAALALYREATGAEPVMWGPAIVGFGAYDFVYEDTGSRSRMPAACFSPRKANMALYLNHRFEGAEALYGRLGKYKKAVSCVSVNKLDDVDLDILREIVAQGFSRNMATNP